MIQSLFSSHLPHMRHLTHLRLHGRGEIGPRPNKASSLWPGVVKARDIAFRYAQLMKSKCPSLQFIRIEKWAWQATTKDDQVIGDDYANIELRELDYLERSAIPLFAIAHLSSQSGLPMSELATDYETSEEEEERFQQLMERIEERERWQDEESDEDTSEDDWEDYDSDEDDSDESDDSDFLL